LAHLFAIPTMRRNAGSGRPFGGRLLPALLLALCALLGPARAARGAQAAAGTPVTYSAGWNLVALPSGTVLPASVGPAYSLTADGNAYEQVANGGAVGGRALWIFFPQDTTLTLDRSAAETSRTVAPPGQHALVGNPSSDATLDISGADAAYSFDPQQGWEAVTSLEPGRGALVQVGAAGSVTLGKVTGDALDATLNQLQNTLSDAPTDRDAVEGVARVAGELLRSRQYARVQALLDDMRRTQEEGLRRTGSAPLPALSANEQRAVVTVRENVAAARDATDAGSVAAADAAIEQARTAAQAASDEAVAVARGGDAAPASLSWEAAGQSAPNTGLAAAGALLRGTLLLTGLGTPPSDMVWTLVSTLSSGGACQVTPAAFTLDGEEQRMLALVNQLRAAHGLAPLQLSANLERTAAWKAHDMVTRQSYGHEDGFGSLVARFDACGYPAGEAAIAENLNGGQPGADAVFADWQSDSSHLGNLLGPDYVVAGIKRAPAASNGGTYSWVWVMEFGSAVDTLLPNP